MTTFSNPLDALNERILAYGDAREWVSVTFKRICRNCGTTVLSDPQLMRRDARGNLTQTSSPLPAGRTVLTHEVPSSYSRCDRCGGSRPLRDDIASALDSATNDRDLAQRVGRILSDYVRRSGRSA